MSWSYEARVEVKGLNVEQVSRVMTEWGWHEEFCEVQADEQHGPYVQWGGSGALCGGETEEEAHQRFQGYFHQINPTCQVRTRWLCTEYIWENADEYGSLEGDEP